MTDKKKFIFSNLLSLVLGIVIGAGGFGIVSNINKNEKVPEQTATLPDSGGARLKCGIFVEDDFGRGFILLSWITEKQDVWQRLQSSNRRRL